jgi:hypothetical protein
MVSDTITAYIKKGERGEEEEEAQGSKGCPHESIRHMLVKNRNHHCSDGTKRREGMRR